MNRCCHSAFGEGQSPFLFFQSKLAHLHIHVYYIHTITFILKWSAILFGNVFSILGFFLISGFPSLLSCFSMLFCFSAFPCFYLLLCFFAFLLFPASPCFSAFLLLCFSAFPCFSASFPCFFAFVASLLLCFCLGLSFLIYTLRSIMQALPKTTLNKP